MATKTSPPAGYLSVAEAAQRLGEGEDDVLRQCQTFKLPAKRTEDGEWVLPAIDLERRLKAAADRERIAQAGLVGAYDTEEFAEKLEQRHGAALANDWRERNRRREACQATDAAVHSQRALSAATHRPRARCSRRPPPRRTTTASRDSDDPGPSSEGDGDPPRNPLADTRDYLSRLGPHGAGRTWLIDQVAYLGHEPESVSVALTLLQAEGKARRGVGDADTDVIWKVPA